MKEDGGFSPRIFFYIFSQRSRMSGILHDDLENITIDVKQVWRIFREAFEQLLFFEVGYGLTGE
jgi:hypothetical protein